jgi:RNA polymerase sigma-70 factor (family 1)
VESLETYSDKELFELISQNNEAAFAVIFYKYTAKLAPFVTKFLHADLWTEEIVQDTFLKIWQNRVKLSDVEFPAAYIFRIAANRSLDYIKKNALNIRLHYQLISLPENQPVNQTDQDISLRLTNKLIGEAVSNLPPQRQKVYEMARERGMSYNQISDALGISPHTVRNHMAEAIQEIREYLQSNDVLPVLILLTLKNIF